jgi:hypothetical protein
MSNEIIESRSPTDPRTKFTLEAQALFVEHFSKTGRHEESANYAGVDYDTMLHWRKTNPDFTAAFQAADRRYKEKLRREIERRGVDGWLEPMYQGGERVLEPTLDDAGNVQYDADGRLVRRPASVRKFSDRLLELLAKRQDPEFRERVDVQATRGPDATGSTLATLEVRRELEKLSDEGRARLRAVIEEIAGVEARQVAASTPSVGGASPLGIEDADVIDSTSTTFASGLES